MINAIEHLKTYIFSHITYLTVCLQEMLIYVFSPGPTAEPEEEESFKNVSQGECLLLRQHSLFLLVDSTAGHDLTTSSLESLEPMLLKYALMIA